MLDDLNIYNLGIYWSTIINNYRYYNDIKEHLRIKYKCSHKRISINNSLRIIPSKFPIFDHK